FPCHIGVKRVKSFVFKGLAQISCQNVSGQMGNAGQWWNADLAHWAGGFGKNNQPPDVQFDFGRISPDGHTIAAGEYHTGRVRLLDRETGEMAAMTPEYRETLSDLHIGPDGQALVTGYNNGQICCFQLHEPEGASLIITPHTHAFLAHEGVTRSVRFVNPETLVTCGTDGRVKIWKPFQVPWRKSLRSDLEAPHSVAFSPDEKRLLSAYASKSTLSLYDSETGDRLIKQSIHAPVQAIWSPVGRQVAVRSHASNQVYFLDAQLRNQFTLDCPLNISAMDYSPDGKFLATIDRDGIFLFRTKDGKLTDKYPLTDTGEVVRYSHDGKWVAYGGRNELLGLWALRSDGRSVKLPNISDTLCLAFSADDHILATGHSDGIVRLWQVEGAKLLAELTGHSKSVKSVHFSPDGHTLVSSTIEFTCRVWSIPKGRCLGVLDHAIHALSPSGKKIVTGYSIHDPIYPTTFIQSID
ncbi:MAG: hypothetical protein ABGX16_19470, partial [Pirellulales bacterium]